MLAMMRTSPPHSLQVSMSISPKGAYSWQIPASISVPIGQDVPVPRSTGMCASGQVIEACFSAGVWSVSSAEWIFLRLPRLAGVTHARYLLLGAPKVGALGEHTVETG